MKNERGMLRRNAGKVGALMATGAIALVPILSAQPVGAFTYQPSPDGATQWTSRGAGTNGGRELPSVSADGRFVAYVGRGEGQGIWLTDRKLGTTTRLTSGMHFNPAVSDDGQWVAFAVYGSNRAVDVVNVATKAVSQVSLSDSGAPATGLSDFPSISADGRYVAFQSTDKMLDPNVTQPASGGGPNRAYVRDRLTGHTEMVSVTNGGEASRGSALKPDISPDGRYVAFAAEAENLLPPAPAAPGATPSADEATVPQQIYLRDRAAKTTTLVTAGIDGQPGDAISAPEYGPTVSDNGGMVAFESQASNLVAGDTNNDVDAFVRNMTTGTTTRVSVDSSGNQVDLPNPPAPAAAPTEPTPSAPLVGSDPVISGSGQVVAFASAAPLTPDDANGVSDVYAVDLAAGTLERVSLPEAGGTEASGTRVDGHTGETVAQVNGTDPSIDGTGRHISFVTNGNLTGDRPVDAEGPVTDPPTVSTEPATFTRVRFGALDGWYVRALYADLLNRPADTAGTVYWVETLWVSPARSSVPRSLQATSEHRAILVQDAYQQLLGRSADAGGLAYWTGRLAGGTSVESMEATLLGSAEAYVKAGSTPAGFVTYAYDKLLGRTPDSAGQTFWLSVLSSGVSRTSVSASLIRSTEHARIVVDGAYQDLLDRAPDSAGRTFWVSTLTSGQSRTVLVRNLVSSDEYYLRAQTHLGS